MSGVKDPYKQSLGAKAPAIVHMSGDCDGHMLGWSRA